MVFWFKTKKHRWLYWPARWQGWAVVIVYLTALAVRFYRVNEVFRTFKDALISFVPYFAILTIVFIMVIRQTSEKPKKLVQIAPDENS